MAAPDDVVLTAPIAVMAETAAATLIAPEDATSAPTETGFTLTEKDFAPREAISVPMEAGFAAADAAFAPAEAIPAPATAIAAPVEAIPAPAEPTPAAAAEPLTAGGPAQPSRDKPPMSHFLQSPAVERVRSTQAQRIGDDGERLAAIRLEALGWKIVARNLRVGRTEVDVLAIDPSDPPTLVLVEVRRRNRRDFGLAEETVDHRKRSALLRAAGELAMRPVLPDGRRLPDLPIRVDLIAIDRGPDGRPSLRHHRGFEA